jgi:hypothetical protein
MNGKTITQAAVGAALLGVGALALVLGGGAASAAPGGGTTVQHFNSHHSNVASYVDPLLGVDVNCSGVHQSGKNFSALGQDSETCVSTTGAPVTYYGSTTDEFGVVHYAGTHDLGVNGWYSDWYNLPSNGGQYVLDTSAVLTLADDGKSYTVVANF